MILAFEYKTKQNRVEYQTRPRAGAFNCRLEADFTGGRDARVPSCVLLTIEEMWPKVPASDGKSVRALRSCIGLLLTAGVIRRRNQYPLPLRVLALGRGRAYCAAAIWFASPVLIKTGNSF
jgi:hypothetical protein